MIDKRTIERVDTEDGARFRIEIWDGPEQVDGDFLPYDKAITYLKNELDIPDADAVVYNASQAIGLPYEF